MARARVYERKEKPPSVVNIMKNDPFHEQVRKSIQTELALLKRQLMLQTTGDSVHRRAQMMYAVLRMNISALQETYMSDFSRNPSAANLRKKKVDELINLTNEFVKKGHTEESIDIDCKALLDQLAETFDAFGAAWQPVRESVITLALEQMEELRCSPITNTAHTSNSTNATKNECGNAEEEKKMILERMEKREKERRDLEYTERKEREKQEKENKKKQKKKKGAKKDSSIQDDFGDERVPPRPTCDDDHCLCHRPPVSDECTTTYSVVPSDPTPSRSSSLSDDRPSIMSYDYWSQFCYFYDIGSHH